MDEVQSEEEDYSEPVPKKMKSPKKVQLGSAASKTKAKIEEVITTTNKKSIAGKHIATMSATERDDVVSKLTKRAKTNENKHVKAAVLGVSYDNLFKTAFLEHLQGLQGPVATMVHARRRTLAEEQGLFAQIKIGDWVEVEPDYSPSICSDDCIGCVLGLHNEPCVPWSDLISLLSRQSTYTS